MGATSVRRMGCRWRGVVWLPDLLVESAEQRAGGTGCGSDRDGSRPAVAVHFLVSSSTMSDPMLARGRRVESDESSACGSVKMLALSGSLRAGLLNSMLAGDRSTTCGSRYHGRTLPGARSIAVIQSGSRGMQSAVRGCASRTDRRLAWRPDCKPGIRARVVGG